MKPFLKTGLFVVSLVLSFGITEADIPAGESAYSGEYSAGENHQHASVYPVSAPHSYGIQRTGSSAIDLLRNLPAPNAVDSPENDKTPDNYVEKSIQRSVSAYLTGSKTINSSQTARELLFPFHHFL